MVTSIREFNADLYLEHLEEASFLYEQRLAYLHDAELTWKDLGDLEARFEAHIDALVVGDRLALEVCDDRVKEGDWGELHAALRLFCRQRSWDRAYAVLRDIDAGDIDAIRAAGDALKAECAADWLDELSDVAARRTELAPVLATVLGHRRARRAVPTLLEALKSASEPATTTAVLWALGRLGDATIAGVVDQHCHDDTRAVSDAACRAAIRLGHDQTVRYMLLAVQTRPWLAPTLALGGDRSAVNMLTDQAGERVTAETLIGLGLLGDLTAVRPIFECLALPERASDAALALQLITGAELYEEVFVPEEVDPDELFDDERERYEATGEAPKRVDGEPLGVSTIQVVTDQAVWKEWLSRNKARFDRHRRYRYGELYSPRSLLASLAAERVPNRIRALICDEFRVRYGVDFPLEIDMRVVEQHSLLARMAEWVQANERRFESGRWYFHGRPMN